MTRDRNTLSDQFNRSDPVFSKKVQFIEAFPDIKSIELKTKEKVRRYIFSPDFKEYERTYDLSNMPGEYLNCGSYDCKRGGYHIGSVIRTAYRNKDDNSSGVLKCPGDNGTPKGRRKGDPCGNSISYGLAIKYKE